MIDTKDIYWLAGLLEGEGCFYLQKAPSGGDPRIGLTSTDQDVVNRAAALVGSRVHRYVKAAPRQPVYQISVNSRNAAGWMMTLYPLMGLRRRERIREVLVAWAGAPRRRLRTCERKASRSLQ